MIKHDKQDYRNNNVESLNADQTTDSVCSNDEFK